MRVNAANVSAALTGGSPERLPRWANTLLVIAIGVALAFLMLKAIPTFLPVAEASVANPSLAAPSSNRESGPNPRQLASAIADRHLFGDFTKPVEVVKEEPKRGPAPKTRLNLKLAGVFAYNPVERSMAIVSVDNGDQEASQIGARIVGETTLEEVHSDHIIIKNRGKLEKVSMAEDIKPLPASQLQAAAKPAQAGAGANGGAGVDPDAPIELPSTSPGAIRDYLARNPALLGRVVAAEPYQENGKLLGYKITPKQNPEILEAQGIVAGDVITRVNNIQINSQKQGIRALRNVVKAEQLEVMVLRNGVEVPLSISLTQ